jgi:hypothetical protein
MLATHRDEEAEEKFTLSEMMIMMMMMMMILMKMKMTI